MFEGDFADMCAKKFLLKLLGCQTEGLARADPGASTPIGVKFCWTEDDLHLVLMDYDLQFIVNFFQMEDNHNDFLMEDDQKISF
jgi:hypothetical protein